MLVGVQTNSSKTRRIVDSHHNESAYKTTSTTQNQNVAIHQETGTRGSILREELKTFVPRLLSSILVV